MKEKLIELKNFELILDYLGHKPEKQGEWAKYERVRQAVINMFPNDIEATRSVNGLLSITSDKGRKEARAYLLNKWNKNNEVFMEKLKELSREERCEIAVRNRSDRLVDSYLESMNEVQRELALGIAGEYYAKDKNNGKFDRKTNMLGALLERAKNMDDCIEKDKLLTVILKNLGFSNPQNKMESFKIKALKTVMHGKDAKTKDTCIKYLLASCQGR